MAVSEANYSSGDDYVVEFLGYRFGFNAADFEQRVTAAAVRLGLIGGNELDEDEVSDLVQLAEKGWIDRPAERARPLPRAALGDDLARRGRVARRLAAQLVFRGAWLDHRVKQELLEVAWEDDSADFAYLDPRGGRALLDAGVDPELARAAVPPVKLAAPAIAAYLAALLAVDTQVGLGRAARARRAHLARAARRC